MAIKNENENNFVLKVSAFVKVNICGLEYDMLPDSQIAFNVFDLQKYADLGVGETIVIKIEPKQSYYL